MKYRAQALVTVKVVSWDLSYGRYNGVYTSYRPLQLKIYALNLSISLSAGKESNSDAPSNGE